MSLSNLAILHNQRGENELAAPLYERALDIFERHFGPSSPSVAHTLTDLAVLHLEQVSTQTVAFRGAAAVLDCRSRRNAVSTPDTQR